MNELMKLGEKYGAMKLIYTKHQFQKNSRAACQWLYPKYLDELRHAHHFNLLELGIGPGGSLRMWKEYFPNASIYGLDIDPDTYFKEDRIKIWIGSQDDEVLLKEIMDELGDVSLVIDDAGHAPAAQAISFNFLLPHIPPDGLYIIEDLRLAYDKKRNGGGQDHPWGILAALDNVRQGIAQGDRGRQAEFIHFHNNVAFIGK